MSIHSKALAAALVTGSLVALTGCAQQVGDIDRTQPNKIEKSVFTDGAEWYVQSTVVEVPSTSSSTFVGLQGRLDRVRWKIEEDYLIAYRTNEAVVGLDTNDFDPETDNFEGAIVAAYGTRHFDVQRAYNSSTGEQSNVIVENASDRVWYEREFMRVNWDSNRAPVDETFDPAVEVESFTGLTISAQDQAANPEDISWRVERNAAGEVTYIDVVNTYVAQPDWFECIITFGFPFYFYNGGCGPETIKVRTSFNKIDPSDDGQHEPRVYDDLEMEKFGYFRTERCVYDRLYGCRDQGMVYMANNWRIWDDARNADGTFKRFEDRTPKPVVYYFSTDFPEDLIETSQEIARQWDDAFGSVHKFYHPTYEGPSFVLCANPGSADDPMYRDGHCKNPGQVKNLGDLRYPMFSWIDNNQMVGPLGYGPSGADPMTGEIKIGVANIYGAAIDRYAQYVLDILMLETGDIDPNQFADGINVAEYLENRKEQGLFLGYDRLTESREASLTNLKQKIEGREGAIFDLVDDMKGKTLSQRLERLKNNNRQEEVWPKLRGTQLERLMITDEMKMGLGRDHYNLDNLDAPMTEEAANLISPARMGTMAHLRGQEDRRFDRFSSRNMMMGEYFDPSYLGLANEMKDFMENFNTDLDGNGTVDRFDKMEGARLEIRKRLYKGVMEHEVGHTLGLRHNFEGSFDAVNFDPKYWEIRFMDYDGDGQNDPINPSIEQQPRGFANTLATEEGLTGDAREARVNEIIENIQRQQREQVDNKLHEYRLSSIMDYGAKLNNDFHGIGFYDYAAIRYAYGELVDVFDTTPTKLAVDYGNSDFTSVQPTNEPITDWEDIDTVTGALAPDEITEYNDSPSDGQLDNNLDFYHYGTLPVLFSGMEGDMSNMYARSIMRAEDVAASGKLQVPYRFCSDEYRGGTPSCDVWDQGASFEEILDDHIQTYENYYIFNNFRRGRATWGLSIIGHLNRFIRTFSTMTNIYQHWVIRLFFNDTEWYVSDWGGRLGWAGIERGIGTMMNVLVSPHPGTYAFDEETTTWTNISSDTGFRFGAGENTEGYSEFMDIPVGVGKYDFSRYDNDSGYYFFYRYQIMTTFWERWAAMMALTSASTNFIGVDGSSDLTAFSIPISLLYSEELYRWFGAVINEDMTEIGPIVAMGEDNKMGFEAQNPLASAFQLAGYSGGIKLNPYSDGNEFNMPIFAMAYGLGMFQDRYDRTFNALGAVYMAGRGESVTAPEGANTISWTDPVTGNTYYSFVSTFLEDKNSYPTAWNMVAKAQEYEDKWRAEHCSTNGQGEESCDTRGNSEFFAMTGHREQLDILVLTNRVFDNYNDTSWIVDPF